MCAVSFKSGVGPELKQHKSLALGTFDIYPQHNSIYSRQSKGLMGLKVFACCSARKVVLVGAVWFDSEGGPKLTKHKAIAFGFFPILGPSQNSLYFKNKGTDDCESFCMLFSSKSSTNGSGLD